MSYLQLLLRDNPRARPVPVTKHFDYNYDYNEVILYTREIKLKDDYKAWKLNR